MATAMIQALAHVLRTDRMPQLSTTRLEIAQQADAIIRKMAFYLRF